MTIKDIEQAIVKLSPKKLMVFRSWFHKFDACAWDKQFEKDVNTGKLDAFADKAIDEFKKGHCKEL